MNDLFYLYIKNRYLNLIQISEKKTIKEKTVSTHKYIIFIEIQ